MQNHFVCLTLQSVMLFNTKSDNRCKNWEGNKQEKQKRHQRERNREENKERKHASLLL